MSGDNNAYRILTRVLTFPCTHLLQPGWVFTEYQESKQIKGYELRLRRYRLPKLERVIRCY
jgi:hypothetical protein